MEKKWKVLSADNIFSTRIMNFRTERCELPDGRIMPKYYIVDFPDWVHTIGLTEQNEVILLKQYRHATRKVYWEVPGGTMDPGSPESPLEAAQRELREETGYTSNDWKLLGVHDPNPAIQTNRLHTYLALNCKKTHDTELDPYEDLELDLKALKETFEMLKRGEFSHSLMMSSLVLAWNELELKLK